MPKVGTDRAADITPEQAFAKSLKRVRTQRSISQEELGFESGYHRTYISLLERGKMNPSLRTILSLAAALDTPAAELIRNVERLLVSPWRRESSQ
jgi:transcriptional regulator with XRE-family HTH domain